MLAQFIGIMGGMAVSPVLAGSLGIKAMLIWYGMLAFALLLLAGAILGFFQLGLAPIFMEVASDVCKPAPEATTQGVLWMFGQGISVLFIF